MKVKSQDGAQLSGKMGNIIYYTRGGKTFARRAAIPGKKRKWETEGRNPAQAATTRRFGVMQRMYSLYAREVSAEIWRAAGRAAGKMAANLFNSTNFACIDGQGRMANPESFAFSAGELTLPPGLRMRRAEDTAIGSGPAEPEIPASAGEGEAAREAAPGEIAASGGTAVTRLAAADGAAEGRNAAQGNGAEHAAATDGAQGAAPSAEAGGGRYVVEWEAEEAWALAAPTDRLMAGVLYADDPLSPRLAAEVSGRRGDLRGEFRLDPSGGLPAHVYLFFAREDGTAYSPSRHFPAE